MASQNLESRVFKLNNELGMHARPASLFVQTANNFHCEVKVEKDGNIINGKSVMELMVLAAEEGSSLKVTAEGEDASEALDALEKLFQNKFGED